MRSILSALTFALLLAGCASPRLAAPDLTGRWVFQVATGPDAVTHGAMTVVSGARGYAGTLTTDQGANVLPISSLSLDGSTIRMLVDSPNGPVTFEGVLAAEGRAFDGVVTYYNGQHFRMTGLRG